MAQKRQSGDVLFYDTFHQKIGEHFRDISENPNIMGINELEFRLGTSTNEGFSTKFRMPVFRRVVTYLRERYTDTPPKEELQLDISFDARSPGVPEGLKRTRVRIPGSNAISQFCRFNKIDPLTAKVETKEKEETTDMDEYGIRIQSSLETTLDKELSTRIANIINNPAITKYYRYKKRYSWIDGDVRWDLTVVKSAAGKTFEGSNVLKKEESYEIELEYLIDLELRKNPGDEVNPVTIQQVRMHVESAIGPNLKDLIKVYNETFEIMSTGEQKDVIEGYAGLVGIPRDTDPYFIGMDLVALDASQLLPDPTTGKMPIENKLATPKADGKRNLLYVYDGPVRALQGNIYLINNRMQVFGTGLVSDQLGNLFDTELVRLKTGKYAALLFDTLFHLGKDLRCTASPQQLQKSNQTNPQSGRSVAQQTPECPPSTTNSEANMGLVSRLRIIKGFLGNSKQVMEDIAPELRGKEYYSIYRGAAATTEGKPSEIIGTAETPEIIGPEHFPLVIPMASGATTPLWPNEVILQRDWDYDLDGIVFTPLGPYPDG